jgi:hypothetical protein
VVLFTPAATADDPRQDKTVPLVALVAYVHSDRCINVAAFDQNGHALAGYTSVTLLQGDDPKLEGGYFASWMPFQKGQAVRTEQLGAQLEARLAALEEQLGALALEHPKHSKTHQVSASDIVIVREPGKSDAPGLVVNVGDDYVDTQVFRGDHTSHALHTLHKIDPATGKIGWFWPSEQS